MEQGTWHSIYSNDAPKRPLHLSVNLQNSPVTVSLKKVVTGLYIFSKGRQFSSINLSFQSKKSEKEKTPLALCFPSLRLFRLPTGSVVSFQNNLLTQIMSLGP